MTVAVFGGVLLTNIDLLSVKFMSPAADSDALSGAYQVAAVLARAPLFVGTALIQVFYPRIAQWAAADASPSSRAPRQLLSALALLVLPLNVLMAVGSSAVILFFFPSRYLQAAPILSILAIGSGFLAFATALASIHQARGRSTLPALIMGGAVVAQVLGLLLVVPGAGMWGAASISAAASLLACVLLASYSRGWSLTPVVARRQAAALGVLALTVVPLATVFQTADRLLVGVWIAGAMGLYVVTCLLLNVLDASVIGTISIPLPTGRHLVARLVRYANLLNHAGRHLEHTTVERMRHA
jgi:O-antigen/teichoic acid export membrane protein